MKEENKKFSFISKLDNVLQDNYINNDIVKYTFYSVCAVILNNVRYNVNQDEYVIFILHLDELIVEIYRENDLKSSYSLPYCFIDDIHIFLEEKHDS
jgi:hypothetical protein